MKKMCAQFNITLHVVNVEDLDSIRSLLDKHGSLVRCVYVESVENPTLRVADLEAISALTEPRGVPFVVDNTFATGYNTQPFRYALLCHQSSSSFGSCLYSEAPWLPSLEAPWTACRFAW